MYEVHSVYAICAFAAIGEYFTRPAKPPYQRG